MNSVRRAGLGDVETVGFFVRELLSELGVNVREVDFYQQIAKDFFQTHHKTVVLISFKNQTPIGMISAVETVSIYAGGLTGVINELYVIPTERSMGIAAEMIKELSIISEKLGWLHIDVGAPPQPAWSRTLTFYKRYGFKEIGPRLRLKPLKSVNA